MINRKFIACKIYWFNVRNWKNTKYEIKNIPKTDPGICDFRRMPRTAKCKQTDRSGHHRESTATKHIKHTEYSLHYQVSTATECKPMEPHPLVFRMIHVFNKLSIRKQIKWVKIEITLHAPKFIIYL